MMDLEVFAFEDEPEPLQGIKDALEYVSPKNQQHYGIRTINLKVASSKQEALALLRRAARLGKPPDVILLDLQIPMENGGVPKNNVGIELLKEARTLNAAKEVLVYSKLGEDYELAVDAFSRGAIDFIRKGTVSEEELLVRVLAAGARLLARENAKLLDQRLKDLVPYAETGLAHRLGVCFSRFVQSVVNETEGLEEGLKERWGLDVERDAQDSQVRHLIEMKVSVQQAKKDWTDIVASLMGRHEMATDCVVEDALAEVQAELMPSLSLNRVELSFNRDAKTVVRTFRNGANDVKAVLKEILLGGLSEPILPHNQVTHVDEVAERRGVKPVDVTVTTKDGQADIQFKDSLNHIGEQAAGQINGGMIIPPGRTFGRAWGLSVAQHLAQRGGGRLRVHSNGSGNTITYSVPMADHAKSASGR
jgi:CheY-like chemotaxis protein